MSLVIFGDQVYHIVLLFSKVYHSTWVYFFQMHPGTVGENNSSLYTSFQTSKARHVCVCVCVRQEQPIALSYISRFPSTLCIISMLWYCVSTCLKIAYWKIPSEWRPPLESDPLLCALMHLRIPPPPHDWPAARSCTSTHDVALALPALLI